MTLLIELDLQRYTDDIILDTVNYINDHWPHEQYRTKWSSYLFFLEVCKKCSDHYDIKGCNSLEKEILSDMELQNKEKIKEKEKKERNIRDKVAKLLPKQPWTKGIHKQIAQELGLKNWEVSNAISALIESGAVYYQKDGIVYDKQGREIKGANQEIN